MKVIIDRETEIRAKEVKPSMSFIVAWHKQQFYFLRRANIVKETEPKYIWQSFENAGRYYQEDTWPEVIDQFDEGQLSIHAYNSIEHFCKDYLHKIGRR